MPIVFETPSPMGSAASIGVGAGIADIDAKEMPSILNAYLGLAKLRQGGGGGGGGVSSGGGFNRGGGGGGSTADNDVQQQANREQRAVDLGFQAEQPDYVGQHIQMEQQFKLQQDQQKAKANAQAQKDAMQGLIGQPTGQPQTTSDQSQTAPPEFTKQDADNLVNLQKSSDDAEAAIQNGTLKDADAIDHIRAVLGQQITNLQDKQQTSQQYATQLAQKQASDAASFQNGLQDRGIMQNQVTFKQHANSAFIDKFGPDGKYQATLQWNPKNSTYEPIKGTEAKADNSAEVEAKRANDNFNSDLKLAHEQLLKEAGKTNGVQNPISHDALEARRLEINQTRADDEERRGLVKNANPQVRAAYTDSLSSLPKLDGGKINWNGTSDSQFLKIIPFLKNPGQSGIMKKEATDALNKIQEISEARKKLGQAGTISVTPEPTQKPVFQQMLENYAAADHSK